MAGVTEEGQEILAADSGGRGVFQRMEVRAVRAAAAPASRMTVTAPARVVDHAEGRDRAGHDAEQLGEKLRPAEGEAGAADPLVQRLHVDLGVLLGDDQEDLVLLVLEEEVLGVAAGDLAAQRLALLDGEERRMLDGRGRDAELFAGRRKDRRGWRACVVAPGA